MLQGGHSAVIAPFIHHAASFTSMILTRWGDIHRLIDAAEVYARCVESIVYGRCLDPKPTEEITGDKVKTAVNVMLPIGSVPNQVFQDRLAATEINGRTWPEN